MDDRPDHRGSHGAPGDARRGVLGALHDARGGSRRGRPPEPGAHEALDRARAPPAIPWRCGPTTPGPIARRALARCGLDPFFATLVTRDEAALKPDPAGLRLLEAAFPERRIWVVGDSWVDGAAAQAGGAGFIAYGADPAELARRGVAPRTVLRDLRQLPEWLRTAAW